MELYHRLGRAVADYRTQLGLTQGQVAEKIGLSRASLANLESGRQRIMVHQLYALANVLGRRSILDLVPEVWASPEPLPEIEISGSPLSPKEKSGVEGLLASALAKKPRRKRSQ